MLMVSFEMKITPCSAIQSSEHTGNDSIVSNLDGLRAFPAESCEMKLPAHQSRVAINPGTAEFWRLSFLASHPACGKDRDQTRPRATHPENVPWSSQE